MKHRPVILRCIALLLALVFLQKSGAGLFIHNFFHIATQTANQDTNGKEISLACSCIDDFLMPFTGAEEVSIEPTIKVYPQPSGHFQELVVFRYVAFSALRGPPSVIA